MTKKVKRLTITWAKGPQTVIENVTCLSYQGRGSFLSDGPSFVCVHGIEGPPVEIFQMDHNLKHLKLEDAGEVLDGTESDAA